MLVVFVDDEPGVLQGIESSLLAQGVPWTVFCIPEPEEALEVIAREPVDVVVADLRMPRMDGAQLLEKVRAMRPNAVRIILSEVHDPDLLRRAMNIAHGFLAKPCPAPLLVEQIERGYGLRAMLENEELRQIVNSIGALPAAPTCYLELTRLIDDPKSSAQSMAAVIRRDPALAAKVLQLCNSAYFSMGHQVADIDSAVTRLGIDNIRQIVLLTEVYSGPGLDRAQLERRQQAAAMASALIPAMDAERAPTELARTAALLAGVGDLLLMKAPNKQEIPPHLYAQLGAYLLALWNLPVAVVEAVALHQAPSRGGSQFDVVGMVHVATSLVNEQELDESYLEEVGVADHLPQWRKRLEKMRERVN